MDRHSSLSMDIFYSAPGVAVTLFAHWRSICESTDAWVWHGDHGVRCSQILNQYAAPTLGQPSEGALPLVSDERQLTDWPLPRHRRQQLERILEVAWCTAAAHHAGLA